MSLKKISGHFRPIGFVFTLASLLAAGCATTGAPAAQPEAPKAEAAAPAEAVKPAPWKDDQVVLKMGEKQMTYGEMKEMYKTVNPKKGFAEFSVAEQKQFMTRHLTQALLVKQARQEKLDQISEFVDRTRVKRYKLYVPVFRQREIVEKVKVSEEELMAYIPPALDEVMLRIIVKNDAEAAKKIYQRVTTTEDFAAVAEKESEGFLRERGGLTGWMSAASTEKFPAPMIEKFLKAPVGTVLEPFYMDIGTLVVKIEQKRTGEDIRKEELSRKRGELISKIYDHHYSQAVEKLNQKAVIVRNVELCNRISENGPLDEFANQVVYEINGDKFYMNQILGDVATVNHGDETMISRLDKFATTAVIAQEAIRLGYATDPLYLQEWTRFEERELVEQLRLKIIAEVEKEPVTDEDYKAYMAAKPKEFMTPEALNVSVILCGSEEAATKALERIAKGEDFAAIAAEVSTHAETAKSGGSMGMVDKKTIPPIIVEALEGKEVGYCTTPPLKLEDKEGNPIWLIVKHMGEQKPAPMSLESAKTPTAESRIRTLKRTDRLDKYIKDLKSKYGYEICF